MVERGGILLGAAEEVVERDRRSGFCYNMRGGGVVSEGWQGKHFVWFSFAYTCHALSPLPRPNKDPPPFLCIYSTRLF